MKVNILGQVVQVPTLGVILDSGHQFQIQQVDGGMLILSGNASLEVDEQVSNARQVLIKVNQLTDGEVIVSSRTEFKL